jgi:hypothetical protein
MKIYIPDNGVGNVSAHIIKVNIHSFGTCLCNCLRQIFGGIVIYYFIKIKFWFQQFDFIVWTCNANNITAFGKLSSTGPVLFPSYTVTGVPPAAGNTGGMIYVSNEVGGATMAFSDGTNWRRVTDRAIVS